MVMPDRRQIDEPRRGDRRGNPRHGATTPPVPLLEDFSRQSDTLLILFGGIAGAISMPPFEFFKVSDAFPTKRLFVRDLRYAWYCLGLPGHGTDSESVLTVLRQSVERSGARRVVTVGASAGGFAAIKYGVLLGAESALAFSPQSMIDATNRARLGDERWAPQIAALHARLGPNHPEFTIGQTVDDNTATAVDIRVSREDLLDLAHADILRDRPGVRVTEYDYGGHLMVKWLRDSGELAPILTDTLGTGGPGRLSEPSDAG